MADSITVETYKMKTIADTGYHTWLNFWLNMDMMNNQTKVASYRDVEGNLAEIALPFSEQTLELLVREEFTIILEHLSFVRFEDFERTTTIVRGKTVEPIDLVVRATDGSVYLRQYYIDVNAFNKLKALFATPANYKTWIESSMPWSL